MYVGVMLCDIAGGKVFGVIRAISALSPYSLLSAMMSRTAGSVVA